MWSSAELSSVVQSIRTLDGQDRLFTTCTSLRSEHPDPGRTGRQRTAVRRSGDHLGALDVSTGVWGGDQPPGGARPSAPDQTAAIRLLRRNGQSQSAVARTFGVSRQTVWSAEQQE